MLQHGWSGKNPQRLAEYVEDINAAERPPCRPSVREDCIDRLRRLPAESG